MSDRHNVTHRREWLLRTRAGRSRVDTNLCELATVADRTAFQHRKHPRGGTHAIPYVFCSRLSSRDAPIPTRSDMDTAIATRSMLLVMAITARRPW